MDFYFGPPDFFTDFVVGFVLLIFVGKSGQENPPGKSPAKSSKIYTTKIPDTFLQRGRAKVWGWGAFPLFRFSFNQPQNITQKVRNTPSTAGNSMTDSERPSPEPLLKKEASPAVLGGREFWKCSGSFKCLEL